ncbi:P-loop containing nucleoside triphosphate hydrolase [Glarea lozoyensis ATCC 20868]|uniref:p-loop containing nucleoside triphosphate hydrolase n=1 Tax=Glarea lozoyensis (strain ATCC 20868 / MF5171) TaxID=1116229 RepID=S3DE61_GLAL2|nr:P-loop containing nucleoside triphosphate hydrolase [Glarea lozoyensis ATCC 20868]EPE24943.1 P-loop containing nucleoside triphosphate hydrolase [Glarea lozoyensis ATCC 20868]
MAATTPTSVWIAIATLHYAYPALTFFYFLFALTITVCMLQTQSLRVQDAQVRRDVMLGLIFAVAGTYLIESVAVLVEVLFDSNEWYPTQDHVVYLISSLIAFGIQAVALTDAKFPVWYPYYGTWFIGICVEITLLALSNVYYPPNSTFSYAILLIQCLRIVTFIILVLLFFVLRNDTKEYDNADAEQQSLLRNKLAGKPGSSEDSSKGYGTSGTTTAISKASSQDSWVIKQAKAQELVQKRLKQDGNWFTYAKGFAVFFPHVWPMHNKGLQFRALLVAVCLLATNALNVLVPNQMGVMIDSLTKYTEGDHARNVWLPVAIYIIFRFVNSGACVGWIQKWLWLPVEQYSYDALSTASHAHIMTLSSDFHDSKTSSDLIQAVQGGRSVADLLETVCFQVVPMFIDLAIAFGYLWSIFGPYMGLMMAATASTYLYVTTKLISMRAEKRRNFIAMMRKEWSVGYASLDGWTTASMFNMIPYEQDKYAGAVKDHLGTKYHYDMSAQSINAAQGLIMTIGLLGALWLGVYQVAFGGLSVGKFTTLLVYWAQLAGPLTFFSSMFKNISYSLMDAEKLLELFQTKPTITDSPNAKMLKLDKGEVRFDNVSFAYDERKPTLKNVSFTIPAGKTVALVGETGGGKSTILKLLDRFYDVSGGSITIDNQDIRNVKLSSLRENIGIVPQDPTLFNMSIMENIRYSRLSATDEEVYDACKAAAVHDKIMTFPDGYDSQVGNMGVKLSGGEKQRVAIARAILKQPEIILLDEATSAVDTETEHLIQEGFRTLCRNRTTFIVAHRLSTIMRADQILVVMDGEIVEAGSHQDLIHAKGKYHNLWTKQIFVKPSDERSRSRSPKKQDASIVNDLSPSKKTVELGKVLNTTEHNCDPAVEEETKNNDGKKKDSSHQREGSKLKADAPEFVPSSLKTDAAEGTSKKYTPKEAAKAQKKLEKEEKKAASLRKKIAKKARFQTTEIQGDTESIVAEHRAEQLPSVEEPAIEISKSKRSRTSRRTTFKSEPNRVQNSHDGAQDSDAPTTGSGESQALLQPPPTQKRRVSAPSDPPTSTQEIRTNRSRRIRHWRVRNHSVKDSGSTLGSALASYDPSTDEMSSLAAPTTSPADEGSGVGAVRFAAGS